MQTPRERATTRATTDLSKNHQRFSRQRRIVDPWCARPPRMHRATLYRRGELSKEKRQRTPVATNSSWSAVALFRIDGAARSHGVDAPATQRRRGWCRSLSTYALEQRRRSAPEVDVQLWTRRRCSARSDNRRNAPHEIVRRLPIPAQSASRHQLLHEIVVYLALSTTIYSGSTLPSADVTSACRSGRGRRLTGEGRVRGSLPVSAEISGSSSILTMRAAAVIFASHLFQLALRGHLARASSKSVVRWRLQSRT